MKKSTITISCIVIGLIIFGAASYFTYWNTSYYDDDCLIEIAIDFCEDKNISFYEGYATRAEFLYSNSFYCEKESDDLRKRKRTELEFFYFLDEELEGCIK